MVTLKIENNILTACIYGEIDHHTARGIREKIDEKIETSMPKKLILDFSKVGFMDSSGIGLIMGRYKLISRFGGTVSVINTNDAVNKVLILSGVMALIDN